LCCPDTGSDACFAYVPVYKPSEKGQQCDEEEHACCSDARSWIPAQMPTDQRSVAAPVRSHVVIAAHLDPLLSILRAESRVKVKVPFGVRRTVARPPRLRCHTTMAMVMASRMASGIAAGG
jgi:hypothetical protein